MRDRDRVYWRCGWVRATWTGQAEESAKEATHRQASAIRKRTPALGAGIAPNSKCVLAPLTVQACDEPSANLAQRESKSILAGYATASRPCDAAGCRDSVEGACGTRQPAVVGSRKRAARGSRRFQWPER